MVDRLIEDAGANEPADPHQPAARLLGAVAAAARQLPSSAADSGSSANWYARDIKIRQGMMASLSRQPGHDGAGVPYAIAAKFAFPDRVVIAMVGDGAMQMNGNTELITVAKYWKRWSDPRLIVLVLNNRDLNQVTWEQRAMEGDPKFAASQDAAGLPLRPLRRVARAAGHPRGRPRAGRRGVGRGAVAATGRCVLEAIVDPEVPPLPPHITSSRRRRSCVACPRTTHKGRIVKQTVRQKVDELLPGR